MELLYSKGSLEAVTELSWNNDVWRSDDEVQGRSFTTNWVEPALWLGLSVVEVTGISYQESLLLQVRGLIGCHNFPTLSQFTGAVRLQLLCGVHGDLPGVAQGDQGGGDRYACKECHDDWSLISLVEVTWSAGRSVAVTSCRHPDDEGEDGRSVPRTGLQGYGRGTRLLTALPEQILVNTGESSTTTLPGVMT